MTATVRFYRITNTDNGETKYTAQESGQAACDYLGWPVSVCFVSELETMNRIGTTSKPTTYVKIPCEVCPYQYATCEKPSEENCPTRRDVPDWREWLKVVASAHLCPHVGKVMVISDHRLHLRWVKTKDALRILSPQ